MTRKDGRELVTEYPVTAQDRIDFITADEIDLPEDAVVCRLGGVSFKDDTWMDDDPSSANFDDWGA